MSPEIEKIPTKKSATKRPARKRAVKKVTAKIEPASTAQRMPIKNSYGNIARSVSTAAVIMTALVLIVSPSAVWILGPIIGAMAIFGIALGYFANR